MCGLPIRSFQGMEISMTTRMTRKQALEKAKRLWGKGCKVGEDMPMKQDKCLTEPLCALYRPVNTYGDGGHYVLMGIGRSWESAFEDAKGGSLFGELP